MTNPADTKDDLARLANRLQDHLRYGERMDVQDEEDIYAAFRELRALRLSLTASGDVLRDALPEGLEEQCDECGGDPARCLEVQPNCYIRRGRAILAKGETK